MSSELSRLNAALAGRYRLERELGQGGMATVYLAHDVRHDRLVALKVLRPELAAVIGAERFLAEIKTTANLQHPHILALFDSGTADGQLFYVMPFVEGESLRDRLTREIQLPVADAVRLASDVAAALEYAHKHGVVHRDIKPENILLQEGSALVADFGIALAVQQAGGKRMTQTGMSLGTPQYMSPEQAMGAKEVDARADLYALGAVTYEMLAGEPPFTGPTAQAIVARVLTEPPKDLTAGRKSVPPNVGAAVHRALEKLPADRFGSAREFVQALADPRFRHDESPTIAVGSRAPEGPRQSVRLALAAAALLAAGGTVGTWLASRSGEQPGAPIRFAFPAGDSVVSDPQGFLVSIAYSPDGRVVAYVGAGPANANQLYTRLTSELASRVLPGTEGAENPFFSPDGRWLGFVAGGALKKVPITGGTPVQLATVAGSSIIGASWGPDDRIVISIDGRLATVPAAGGTLRPVPHPASLKAAVLRPVTFGDGGSALVLLNNLGEMRVGVVSLNTGHTTSLDLQGLPLGVLDGYLVYVATDGTISVAAFDAGGRRTVGEPTSMVTGLARTFAGGIGVAATLSQSGSLAYLAGSSERQLVLVDQRGRGRVLLSGPDAIGQPRFSPDGRRIAGVGEQDLWTLDLSSGAALQRITSDGTNDRVEWTPDGRRLLFRSSRNGSRGLWIQAADGSTPAEKVLEVPELAIWQGVFSPDGRTLAYRTGALGAADIWYRSMDGDTASRPLATAPFTETSPRFSPDGRWVAYVSTESGSEQVYVRPFPKLDAPMRVSLDGGSQPIWSRDGRTLWYRNGRLMLRAVVRGTASFVVDSRDALFTGDFDLLMGHTNYDVSPDGKQFIMTRTISRDRQTILVHDWKYELRARTSGSAR